MKRSKLMISASVAALVMAASAATAQSMRFSDVDTDGNGRLSYAELEAAFGAAGANRLWNRGGGSELSPADIQRINASNDDDDDDGNDDDDDDDDGLSDDDDDDDGSSGGSSDDDDDDGSSDDDDDDGASSGGGSDDNDDDD